MFYCNKCRKDNNWPDTVIGAYVECEVCGKVDYCNDNYNLSSRSLTLPKIRFETLDWR